MYTVQIGKHFLELYNQKTGENLNSVEFFEEIFFPIIFDSEDKKQLYQFIHNSAFTQPSYPKLAKKEGIKISEYRKSRFYEDLELIPKGEKSLSHSALVGARSGSTYDVPSGQVSDIKINISKDDIIYSWIGASFGVSVRGNYEAIIHDDNLLWFLFKGWTFYREFLNQTKNAKGRQLSQWNGFWILYGAEYKPDLDRAFSEVLTGISQSNSGKKNIKITPIDWTDLIFGISRFFNKNRRVLAYIYKFQSGQKLNRTLGFIPIQFHDIKRWYELFEKYLEKEPDMSRKGWRALKEVYKSQFGFERACLHGGIGLKALQPHDLKKYTVGDRAEYASKIPKLNSQEKRIQFLIYQTWLTAMLNKEDIHEVSKELSKALYEHSSTGSRGKTTKYREVEELWKSNNLTQFIDRLTEIMKESDDKKVFTNVVEKIVSDLPNDRFKLFLTLTKFNFYSNN